MNNTNNNPKKITVVAVHGVSDQKPFESARAIAQSEAVKTHIMRSL